MAENKENEKISVGDLVFPTNKAAEEFPEFKSFWNGVTVQSIDQNGVTTVEHRTTHQIHISRLTKGPSAYDPIL